MGIPCAVVDHVCLRHLCGNAEPRAERVLWVNEQFDPQRRLDSVVVSGLAVGNQQTPIIRLCEDSIDRDLCDAQEQHITLRSNPLDFLHDLTSKSRIVSGDTS